MGAQDARIERADGGQVQTITAGAYQRAVERVLPTGSLPLSDVPGDRVQGATVAQASTIGLSVDRSSLVDIRTDGTALPFFEAHIKNLRVDRSSGRARLYKPVILETVFRAVADAQLRENHISFDWLAPLFVQRMKELDVQADEKNAACAFANLAGDVIWLLAYKRDAPPIESSSPAPGLISERISHARLKHRLWDLLQSPDARDQLLRTLQETWLNSNQDDEKMSLQQDLEQVLDDYERARHEQFGSDHPMWNLFGRLQSRISANFSVESDTTLDVRASVGVGNWARVPWVAITGPGQSIRDGVYCVYLFRQDLSGVYATFNQGVTRTLRDHGAREGRQILRRRAETLRGFCEDLPGHGFELDNEIDLRSPTGLGRDYESSTVAYKLYEAGSVPSDEELDRDLDALVQAYQKYLETPDAAATGTDPGPQGGISPSHFSLADAVEGIIRYVAARGFTYEPWHVAQYVTALRTKPFVILAGITGTGKSKLPALVAEATGSEWQLIPVRPDWTDSSDVLGYTDLQGRFRPGKILEFIREALQQDDRHWTCIVDEMNLARVEQYFAEVLSQMEDRRSLESGGFASGALLSQALNEEDEEWASVHLPPNLGLVGTVNMDESSHGFSRKVLDRAFTLELSDVDLKTWRGREDITVEPPTPWPTSAWYPRAIMLGTLIDLSPDEVALIDSVIAQVIEINGLLRQAQLQVGYRSRDEIALFVLHAQEIQEAFRDRTGNSVDPLDLALQMKILPRILGGSNGIRRILRGFIGWSHDNKFRTTDDEVDEIIALWENAGRTDALQDSAFPRTAARLCLMWDRLQVEGFTSFWL